MIMKKLLYLIVVISAISCTQTNEDKIKTAFQEYAQKNFDDPSQLEEIVSIDSLDTISTVEYKKTQKEIVDMVIQFSIIGDSLRDIRTKYFDDEKCRSRFSYIDGFKALLYDYAGIQGYYVDLLDKNISIDEAEKDMQKLMLMKDTIFYSSRLTYRIKTNEGMKLKTCYVYYDTLQNNIQFRNKRIGAYEFSDIPKEIDDFNERYYDLFKVIRLKAESENKLLLLLRREFDDLY